MYWKSPFAALKAVGLNAWVVNARHVKAVPGRKTDMVDTQWLATLARAGLLRASFVPPVAFRQLRLLARQCQKLVGMLSAEKNRPHKVLDAGMRLNVVVSDVHGPSARATIKAQLAGQSISAILDVKGRLRASREELFEALDDSRLVEANAASREHLQVRELGGFDSYSMRAGVALIQRFLKEPLNVSFPCLVIGGLSAGALARRQPDHGSAFDG